MKSVINSIKDILVTFLNKFRIFVSKRNILLSIGLFFSISFCYSSISVFCEFLPTNITSSISEIARSNYEDDSMNFVIYPHKLVDIDVMTYRMVERTTKMRDLYSEQNFLDVYLSDWSGIYSPGCVKFSAEGSDENISFVVMPKNTYIRNEWVYNDFEFIYPQTGAVKQHNAPNEIYITKAYADYLISIDPTIEDGKYSDLVNGNKLYNIPYSWSFKQGDKIHSPALYDVYYTISGILDEKCDAYLRYQKQYGTFFIVNELINLPIPCITTFSVNKDSRYLRNILDVVLDTYKYEATSSTAYSSSGNLLFEYRVSLFDEIDNENSLRFIDYTPSALQKKCDDVFDVFAYKQNIVYLLLFGIISFTSIGISVFLLYKVLSQNNSFNFIFLFVCSLIIWSLGVLLGFGFICLLNITISALRVLTMKYYLIGISILIMTLVLFVPLIVLRIKRKTTSTQLNS